METKQLNHDPVSYPIHYTSHPSGVECIQVVEHLPFNLGNAIKYIWRHDRKNGMEDLRKAQWYLDREIKRLERMEAHAAERFIPILPQPTEATAPAVCPAVPIGEGNGVRGTSEPTYQTSSFKIPSAEEIDTAAKAVRDREGVA